MNRQEAIREGIKELIGNCLIETGCGEGGCPKAERQALEAQERCLNEIVNYLHSQGCVIENKDEAIYHHGYFPKTEPLIKPLDIQVILLYN